MTQISLRRGSPASVPMHQAYLMDPIESRPQDLGHSGPCGEDFRQTKGQDAEYYYALPTPEKTFNDEWATTHAVPISEMLKGWWEDPEKF